MTKIVLNAGSGPALSGRPDNRYAGPDWQEIRLDIAPETQPDIVGSITDLGMFDDGSVDAVWCSHNLEHLHDHEVPVALREFRRVVKPDGIVVISTPDLELVARLILDGRLDAVHYVSPAGPVRALDMIYGHAGAIAEGRTAMSHKTGFTKQTLGAALIDAGFAEVRVKDDGLSLWAEAFVRQPDSG